MTQTEKEVILKVIDRLLADDVYRIQDYIIIELMRIVKVGPEFQEDGE